MVRAFCFPSFFLLVPSIPSQPVRVSSHVHQAKRSFSLRIACRIALVAVIIITFLHPLSLVLPPWLLLFLVSLAFIPVHHPLLFDLYNASSPPALFLLLSPWFLSHFLASSCCPASPLSPLSSLIPYHSLPPLRVSLSLALRSPPSPRSPASPYSSSSSFSPSLFLFPTAISDPLLHLHNRPATWRRDVVNSHSSHASSSICIYSHASLTSALSSSASSPPSSPNLWSMLSFQCSSDLLPSLFHLCFLLSTTASSSSSSSVSLSYPGVLLDCRSIIPVAFFVLLFSDCSAFSDNGSGPLPCLLPPISPHWHHYLLLLFLL